MIMALGIFYKIFLLATGKGRKIRMITISRTLMWLNGFFVIILSSAMAQSAHPGIANDYQPLQERLRENSLSFDSLVFQQQLQELVGQENWSYLNHLPLSFTTQQVDQAYIIMGRQCVPNPKPEPAESGPAFKEICPYGFAAIMDQNQQQLKGIIIGQMKEAESGKYLIIESFIPEQANIAYQKQPLSLPSQQGCKWLVQGVRPELFAQGLLRQIFHLAVDYGC